eukprot:8727207-Karenia_brevis.AAC.1
MILSNALDVESFLAFQSWFSEKCPSVVPERGVIPDWLPFQCVSDCLRCGIARVLRASGFPAMVLRDSFSFPFD